MICCILADLTRTVRLVDDHLRAIRNPSSTSMYKETPGELKTSYTSHPIFYFNFFFFVFIRMYVYTVYVCVCIYEKFREKQLKFEFLIVTQFPPPSPPFKE